MTTAGTWEATIENSAQSWTVPAETLRGRCWIEVAVPGTRDQAMKKERWEYGEDEWKWRRTEDIRRRTGEIRGVKKRKQARSF